MRGHAIGDGSYEVIPQALREHYLTQDPLAFFERALRERGLLDDARQKAVHDAATALVEGAVEAALAAPEPEIAEARRPVFAPGEIHTAFAAQHTERRHG